MITQHTMAMRKPTPTHKNTLSPTHASGATTQPQHPQTTRPATQNITIVSQPTVTNYSKYQRSHRPHDDQRTEAAGASSTRQTPRCGLDWESPAPAPQSPPTRARGPPGKHSCKQHKRWRPGAGGPYLDCANDVGAAVHDSQPGRAIGLRQQPALNCDVPVVQTSASIAPHILLYPLHHKFALFLG